MLSGSRLELRPKRLRRVRETKPDRLLGSRRAARARDVRPAASRAIAFPVLSPDVTTGSREPMRDNPVDALTLIYIARLRDAFGASTESIRPPATVTTVAALRDWLAARGGAWEAELSPARAVRFAVNYELARPDTIVRLGDEVALFPPVTGG
jgi:molybdopterin synthase sulfur carrier subunit